MAKIVDRRQRRYFTVDNEILDLYARQLGVAGIAVYCMIVRHADRATGRTWSGRPLTYASMTSRLGLSRSTCSRAIRTLVKLELIDVERSPGGGSLYALTSPYLDPPADDQTGAQGSSQVTPPQYRGEGGGGTVVTPPQYRGDTTPRTHHVGDFKTTTPTTRAVAVVGDELGVENAIGAALLTAQGVSQGVADGLADTTDIDLLKACVDYWQGGAGGTKELGPGFLVELCRKPTAFGFTLREGVWYAPPLKRGRRPSSSAAVPVPMRDATADAIQRARESARIVAEDERIRAENRRLQKTTS